jgi:two-component system response regulator AtoC
MAATPSHVKRPLAETGIASTPSAIMQSLNGMVAEIAKTDLAILITGESGTGKEVYARLIHQISGFAEAPFKKVNCAAPDAGRSLTEIAQNLRTDRAKGVRSQTLFLDGVDELDLSCQRVLLSVLSDNEQRTSSEGMSVRLISAASSELEKEIEAGRFRQELYFRINGAILRLPALRERREDIALLLDYFLAKHAGELKKQVPVMDGHTLELLTAYHWPGNVRELENIAKKIVALGDPAVAIGDLPAAPVAPQGPGEPRHFSPLKAAARAASRRTETELILQALERNRWNRKRAARELQISYKSLLYKIKQIGVQESGAEGRNIR